MCSDLLDKFLPCYRQLDVHVAKQPVVHIATCYATKCLQYWVVSGTRVLYTSDGMFEIELH